MNNLLSYISTAASEQSNGVLQVGAAVSELDRMTQQNAALVEQAAALKDWVVSPVNEVGKFNCRSGSE